MRSTQRLRERVGRGLVASEAFVGEAVSKQITAHHARRLRALGWEGALNPEGDGWAECAPPPRSGNAIEILVDGADALPAIADALQAARSHVHVTGWYFSPDFALVREGAPLVLRNLLAELAERLDVRVLVWAGAPLPLFRPSRRQVKRMRDELTEGTRIQCELDSRERPMHCHHEKTIVIDDRVAFVGGIDLTHEDGDRFDLNEHPPRTSVGWHDATARIEGPAVGDVAEHFRMRWHEVAGEVLPPVAPSETGGDVELQIVRTVPEKIYEALPRGDFGILESYMRAFRQAERFIYVENQFLWSPEIAACSARSFSIRRTTTSECSSSYLRSRTRARTTRVAFSASSSRPTRTGGGCSRARSTRAPGRSSIPSMCTRRSRSSTTAG